MLDVLQILSNKPGFFHKKLANLARKTWECFSELTWELDELFCASIPRSELPKGMPEFAITGGGKDRIGWREFKDRHLKKGHLPQYDKATLLEMDAFLSLDGPEEADARGLATRNEVIQF